MSSSPDPSNHVLSWISALLTTIGFPVTIYLALTQQPWWYVASLGLVLVIILMAKEVWQKEFQSSSVKAIAEGIRTVRDFPLRWHYQKDYCSDPRKIYSVQEPSFAPSQEFEASLPASEQIFVEPFILRKYSRESPSDFKEKLIQDYLASDSKPLVILGGVGMGKSTLLQHIALTIVDKKKRKEWNVSYKLPFYLSLGLNEFITMLKENEKPSLADVLEVATKVRWKQPPRGWIEHKLKMGQCLILLDGLDEIADTDIRQQAVEWIEHQITTYDKSRFIITSRPQIYFAHPLQRVSVLSIQSFTLEQIDEFIDNWYRINPYNLVRAENLKSQLHQNKYRLHGLACIPLLLRMIIIVHQYLGTLPDSRTQLYKGIFDVYLGKRWRWKEAPQDKELSSAKEKQKILQVLAYKMTEREILEIDSREAEDFIRAHFENMSIITPERFLQSLQNNGILVGLRSKSHYKFAHRSFQEYLAAIHVKDIGQPELLVNHMNRDLKWWYETIVLYCTQADPTPVVDACLREISHSKDALDLALALYFWEPEVKKNIEQQKKSKPEVRRVWERLDQVIGSAMEDKDIKLHEIADTLLRLRRKYLTPDDEAPEEQPIADTKLITCIEYQLFLDQIENHTHQPDHWKEGRCPRGQWLKPVLGVRPSDAQAFSDWLSTQEKPDTWSYRLPTFQETQDIFVVGEPGGGYWIKDGNVYKVIWEKEGPLQSSVLSQDQLDDLSAQDESSISEANLGPEYAHYLSIARNLTGIYSDHEKLYRHLMIIRNRIREHEQFLQSNHNRADERKKMLDKKFDQAKIQKDEANRTLSKIDNLRTERTQACNKKILLQKELDDIPRREKVLQKEKIQLLEEQVQQLKLDSQGGRSENFLQGQHIREYTVIQRSQIKPQIIDINQHIIETQAEIDNIPKLLKELSRSIEEIELQQKQLSEDLENVIVQERQLTKQLEGANEEERRARQRLESATVQERQLTKQLDSACKDLGEIEQQLSSFRVLAKKFDTIYGDFSRFASVRSSDALARNQVLNLDYILATEDNENALDTFCNVVNRSVQELTDRLDQLHREGDILFADVKSDLDHALMNARDLADRFNLITSKRYIQDLDHLLSNWLRWLYQNRSWMRSKRRTRLYIRYFAKVLAQYQLYADSFLIAQSIFRRYSDVYIAFALLEERIAGNISASEGILIVREPTGENHETTQQTPPEEP